jgi:hypothetical protein
VKLAQIIDSTDETGSVFTCYDIPDDWEPPAEWHKLEMSMMIPGEIDTKAAIRHDRESWHDH